MIRDYTDFMNMTPAELVTHIHDGRDRTNTADLLLALADQLETQAGLAADAERLKRELADAEERADNWRDEARAAQRQLDRVRE